jgi:hypothetical protein
MEVAYTLTLEDYVNFTVHMYKKANMPRMPFQIALALVFLVIGASALVLGLGAGDFFTIWVSVLLLVASTFPVTFPLYYARKVRAYMKKLGTEGIVGPIRLVLTDESLVEITTVGRNEANWRDVLGIEDIDGYTFIRLTGLSAAILPRAGFSSDEDYLRVREFARTRIGSGKR